MAPKKLVVTLVMAVALAAGLPPVSLASTPQIDLYLAAYAGDIAAIRAAVEAGADVNAPDDLSGSRPVELAIMQGHGAAVQLLLELGASANFQTTIGVRLVQAAMYAESAAEMLATLLDHARDLDLRARDRFGSAPLLTAIHTGDQELVRLLLDSEYPLDLDDLGLSTAIEAAVMGGSPEMLRLILSDTRSYDVNRTGEYGTPALHHLVRLGKHDLLRVLLEHGRDLDLVTRDGAGLLASDLTEDESILALLADAMVEARQLPDSRKPTADDLFRALVSGSSARVSFLLAAGADPDAVGPVGSPMLHVAILGEDPAMLELLLAARANVEAEDVLGGRPLALAVRTGRTELVRLLLWAGASVDTVGNIGPTPLGQAVEAEDVEMVRLLMDAGASPHVLDRTGMTALDLAWDSGNSAILALLDSQQAAWLSCLRFEEPTPPLSAAPRLATQVGHTKPIEAAAVSSDGLVGLTGGSDNVARLWHLPTGRELRALNGHSDSVDATALSADGSLALTGSRDGTAFLWDSGSGRRLLRLGHAGSDLPPAVLAVALSGDGSLALTATAELGVALWDTAACSRAALLKPPGSVSAASLTPDSRLVVVGTKDGQISIWERATETLLWRFAAHEGTISSLTVSSNGRRLLSTSGSSPRYRSTSDDMAALWDLEPPRVVQHFGPHRGFNGVLLAAFLGESSVLTSDADGFYLWDVATGEKTAEAFDIQLWFAGAAIAPGARCALAFDDVGAMLIDTETLGLCAPPLAGAINAVTSLRSSLNDDALLAATGFAVAWDLEASRELRRFAVEDESVTSADWAGDLVATGSGLGPARLWHLRSGVEMQQLHRRRSIFSQVAFTPDGSALLTASGERLSFAEELELLDQDYTIFLWDRHGRCVARLAEDFPITSLVFAPDGSHFFSIGEIGGSVRKRDLATGESLGEVDFGPGAAPVAISLHQANGGRLAIGAYTLGSRAQLRIVDLSGARGPLAFPGTFAATRAVTFSRDGGRVHAGSDDGIIHTYDAVNGQRLGEWIHGAPVTALTTLGDDRVASGAVDGSIVLWDGGPGEELARLFSFQGGTWLVVDPEGRFDTNDFDGLDSAHWVLPEDPLSPLPLEIFTREYFLPRLLARRLVGERLEMTAPIRDLSDLNLAQPKVEIVRVDLSEANPLLATVTVAVEAGRRQRRRSPPDDEDRTDAYDLRLFRDGQLVAVAPTEDGALGAATQQDLAAWRSSHRLPLEDGRALVVLPTRLPARRGGETIELSAYAFNEDRVKSETARISLEIPGVPRPRSGRAFVVVIGVGNNASYAWRLYTAGNDARLAARQLSRVLERSGRYERVVTVPLISHLALTTHLEEARDQGVPCPEMAPTKERIRTVFALLSGGVPAEAAGVDVPCAAELEVAGPDDAVWIVYSGHGYARQDGSFYLLPYDMDGIHGGNLEQEGLDRAISSDELSRWLRWVDAGELFLAIDACQAAAIVEGGGFRPGPLGDSGFGQLAYDKRMTVVSATRSNAVAVGGGGITGGHGFLSYALFEEGLARGLADRRPEDGRLTLVEWLDYSLVRVPELYVDAVGPESEPQQPSIYNFGRSSDWSWEVSR